METFKIKIKVLHIVLIVETLLNMPGYCNLVEIFNSYYIDYIYSYNYVMAMHDQHLNGL